MSVVQFICFAFNIFHFDASHFCGTAKHFFSFNIGDLLLAKEKISNFLRDFAYVARDRNTRRFMCHVFRCDTPARTIANTLRDICKRLMLQHRPNTLGSLERPERRIIAS